MQFLRFFLYFLFLLPSFLKAAQPDIKQFQRAYPDHICGVSETSIIWVDGTVMPVYNGYENRSTQEKLEHPSLTLQLLTPYIPGIPANPASFVPLDDPGRIRFEPFFLKMYGETEQAVKTHLTTIYWMPTIFGTLYPLEVTRVNHVDQKLTHISHELEELVRQHQEYIPFLANPGGTFGWRYIANTHRLSMHCFGMTIDINPDLSNYWQWDLITKTSVPSENIAPPYKNNIPWEIVSIFEKYGFIWGGKWLHYDSMHFEYRPELLDSILSMREM